jgi:hypothetical protein
VQGMMHEWGRRGMHIGCLWESHQDNIKMDLREIEWDGVEWIDMAQHRDQCRALVNMVLNLRVP